MESLWVEARFEFNLKYSRDHLSPTADLKTGRDPLTYPPVPKQPSHAIELGGASVLLIIANTELLERVVGHIGLWFIFEGRSQRSRDAIWEQVPKKNPKAASEQSVTIYRYPITCHIRSYTGLRFAYFNIRYGVAADHHVDPHFIHIAILPTLVASGLGRSWRSTSI